jgi:hypothetical protein
MAKPFPSKTHIGNHMLHPETLMLNYGYDPQLSEGAVKPPVFLTSTFVFRTAEDGQDFFDYVSGRREPPEGMGAGLVYSRFSFQSAFTWLAAWPRTRNRARSSLVIFRRWSCVTGKRRTSSMIPTFQASPISGKATGPFLIFSNNTR